MGADYRSGDVEHLGGMSAAAPLAGQTRYLCFHGSQIFVNEVQAQLRVMYAGFLRNLYIRLNAGPGGAETVTCTVYVNGAPTALTVQLTGAGVTNTDDVNVVGVNPEDTVTLEAAYSGAAIPSYFGFSLVYQH